MAKAEARDHAASQLHDKTARDEAWRYRHPGHKERLALHAEGWRADVAETGARVGAPGSMAGAWKFQNVSEVTLAT